MPTFTVLKKKEVCNSLIGDTFNLNLDLIDCDNLYYYICSVIWKLVMMLSVLVDDKDIKGTILVMACVRQRYCPIVATEIWWNETELNDIHVPFCANVSDAIIYINMDISVVLSIV